uniref:Uncharacterized protein n=1 Tax=Arundo donax TaxID=35708 RepID=A0A0A9G0J6_ARUDO
MQARPTYVSTYCARLHAHLAAPRLLVVLAVAAHRRRHAPSATYAAAPRRRRRRLSGASRAGAPDAAAGLVVVHPDHEDLPGDPDLPAEARHLVVPRRAAGLPLGHPPPEPLREARHALLLLLRELGPRPPPATGAVAAVTAHASGHRHVHAVSRRRAGGGQHWRRVRAGGAGRPRDGVEERLPVEVAVAAAGGAEHRGGVGVVGGVLAAAVGGVGAKLRGVVAHALAVHLPRPLLLLLLH